MPIPSDSVIGLPNVACIPRSTRQRATTIKIPIRVDNDRAWCCGDGIHIVIVHLLPRKRPNEDVRSLMVVTTGLIVGPSPAIPVEHLAWKCGILIHKVGYAIDI